MEKMIASMFEDITFMTDWDVEYFLLLLKPIGSSQIANVPIRVGKCQ